MAKITFAPGAAGLASALLAQTSLDEPAVPVLLIRWSAGAKESRRGPKGESIWETIETPGWVAEVAAWGQSETVSLSERTLIVEGVRVLLDGKANAESGCLLVMEAEGNLRVEHQET